MAALLLDCEQAGRRQAREVAARGLRGDPGGAGELGGGERAAVHQRVQHPCARRVAGERGNLCKHGGGGHGPILVIS